MSDGLIFRLQGLSRALAASMLGMCILAVTAVAPAHAETRSLKLYNTHTHERVEITFKRNGRFISSGLRELNRFLRDWRRNEITKMDPELFDLVWEVYKQTGSNKAIHVVSGYRSPATNNMLRRRGRGVARKSQHTMGRAMDFFIPGVNPAKLRSLGLRKEVGGVGYYPSSRTPFVHLDTGSVRHWPKMTRRQLSKVFPRGDTLHIPSDGKKMPRYAEALARQKRGSSRSTVVASAPAPRTSPITRNTTDTGDGSRGTSRPPTIATSGGSTGTADSPGLIARIFTNNSDESSSSGTTGARQQTTTASPTPPAPIPSRLTRADTPPPTPQQAPERAPEVAPEPVVVAVAPPRPKPAGFAAIVARATEGQVRPGTLDAQAQRLAEGRPAVDLPAPAVVPEQQPVQVAVALPAAKPLDVSEPTSRVASSLTAVPRPAPAADGVSAIAAATGTPTPARKPQTDLVPSTLAYAPSATASIGTGDRVGVPRLRSQSQAAAPSSPPTSVSGTLPPSVLGDPLARFAALPDRSNPDLIAGDTNTRTDRFATLLHPNQRQLRFLMSPRGRIFANKFAVQLESTPRADRFEGPAVVLLPVIALQ